MTFYEKWVFNIDLSAEASVAAAIHRHTQCEDEDKDGMLQKAATRHPNGSVMEEAEKDRENIYNI